MTKSGFELDSGSSRSSWVKKRGPSPLSLSSLPPSLPPSQTARSTRDSLQKRSLSVAKVEHTSASIAKKPQQNMNAVGRDDVRGCTRICAVRERLLSGTWCQLACLDSVSGSSKTKGTQHTHTHLSKLVAVFVLRVCGETPLALDVWLLTRWQGHLRHRSL